MLNSFYLSLFNLSLGQVTPPEFVGFGSYVAVFNLSVFWTSLRNTIYFWFSTVFLIILGGMGSALILNEPLRGVKYARTILILPWAIPPIVVSVIWKWAFDGGFGIINYALISLNLISTKIPFLGSQYALPAIVVARVWDGFPFAALILLAVMQTIPAQLYEAAKIDGAGIWHRFRHVTLPGIRNTLVVLVILESMWGLREFDLIYGMTQGGPGDLTSMFGWLVYALAFRSMRLSWASAVAWILFLVTYILTLVYFLVLYKKD